MLSFSPLKGQQTYTATQQKKIMAETETELKKLIRMAENRNYGPFMKHLIYNGRDPQRNLRARLNPNDPHDQLYADNTLNRMRHFLEKAALWHNKNFRVVYGYEHDLFVWDLEFTTLKGKSKIHTVSFVKFKEEYLMARFD